jgi:hypothetical protein
MKSRSHSLARGVVLVVLLGGAPAAQAQIPCGYRVEAIIQGPPLPPPSQYQPSTSVTGMNNVGQVVGRHGTAGGDYGRGFVWSQETGIQWLPVPPGAYAVLPADINDHGVIVGEMPMNVPGERRGFVYENGVYTILEPAPGGLWCWASAINNAGQVVGARSVGNPDTPGDDTHPYQSFVWAHGRYAPVPVPPAANSSARCIDADGHIAGWFGQSLGVASTPYLYSDGVCSLPTAGLGAAYSYPSSLSDFGHMAGGAKLTPPGSPAVIRGIVAGDGSHSVLSPLPGYDTSWANGIGAGLVVGASGGSRGTLWTHGHVCDLNDLLLLEQGENITIRAGLRIRAAGRMLAIGQKGLHLVGLVLEPVGIRSDLDGDGTVSHADLATLLSDFGCAGGPLGCVGDMDGDGRTDQRDLGMLLAEYGQACR